MDNVTEFRDMTLCHSENGNRRFGGTKYFSLRNLNVETVGSSGSLKIIFQAKRRHFQEGCSHKCTVGRNEILN
jgi:hypothetical protein